MPQQGVWGTGAGSGAILSRFDEVRRGVGRSAARWGIVSEYGALGQLPAWRGETEAGTCLGDERLRLASFAGV